MLGETYEIKDFENKQRFLFKSTGPKGVIEKVVLFQFYGIENHFNLAFGDVKEGKVEDEVVSNNNDFVKVLATVAKCAYEFIELYPGATLDIKPVDERRKNLYNYVFQRHYQFILSKFEIIGYSADEAESYDPTKFYDEFELIHQL